MLRILGFLTRTKVYLFRENPLSERDKSARAKKSYISSCKLFEAMKNIDTVIVRVMKAEDAEGSARVSTEAMEDAWSRYERDYYPRKALEFDKSLHTPENYTKRIQEPNEFLFVAEEDGKIVGVVTGRISRGYEKEGGLALLGWICTHPSRQGRGVGETLLNHLIEYCKRQKCHKITLHTLPVLMPALKLYLKLGFVPEAYLHREWWGVDFIKMSKWL